MAKAKAKGPEKKAPAKKAAAKDLGKKKAAPMAASPSIGQNVVSAAASMVANKISPTSVPVSGPAQGMESSSFKQLKQALNKPHSQIIGGLLDRSGTGSQKKSSLPFGGGQQVGHNQTIGSDASRKNVPRRTGG